MQAAGLEESDTTNAYSESVWPTRRRNGFGRLGVLIRKDLNSGSNQWSKVLTCKKAEK